MASKGTGLPEIISSKISGFRGAPCESPNNKATQDQKVKNRDTWLLKSDLVASLQFRQQQLDVVERA